MALGPQGCLLDGGVHMHLNPLDVFCQIGATKLGGFGPSHTRHRLVGKEKLFQSEDARFERRWFVSLGSPEI